MVQFKNTVSKFLDTVFSDGIASLFYLFIALPLLYIPGHHVYSRGLRLSYVVAIAFISFLVPPLWMSIRQNIQVLSRSVKVILAGALVLVLVSSIASTLTTPVLLFGREPDYMGILGWLSIVPFGLLFARRLHSLLFSNTTMVIMSAVMLGSILLGASAIADGYRIPGLMMQATTMSIYAVVASVIALRQVTAAHQTALMRRIAAATLVLCLMTVIFTQSRVGYAGIVLVMTYFGVKAVTNKKYLAVCLAGLCLVLPIITVVYKDHFSRFSASSVRRGLEYRGHMYETAGREVVRDNSIVGRGPSTLPVDLNNSDVVPDDIAMSLNEGFMFFSTHDLFLDIAQYFGVLTAAGLLFLFLKALVRRTTNPQEQSELRVIFLVLIANALCNTISPEITVLTFMVLLAMLVSRQRAVSGK